MTRRIRIWAAFLALTCLLAAAMPAKLMTAFAANGRIAFSDPSGSVGSQITVNMEITDSENLASADVMLAYDSNVLEFVSGTNAEGGAGAIRVHGDGGTPNTTKLRFTLTFNALAAGTTKITVTSQEVYDSNSQLVTIERQGDSTVTVGALSTASNDATLRSLQVSPGTLTPAFSPDVDTYAVTVGTDVDKLIVSAECANENATNVVSGNENLQMGENRVTCQVTAQDGETVKEYVIVVTKAEGGASADTSQAAGFPMRVSERTITVLEPDASVEIPEGFVERTIRMDGNEVTGWVWGSDEDPEYCVIYGRNEAGETNFYRYDMKDTERTLQRYFADPAIADSVSQEVYDELAVQYDSLRSDFNLFRILLIAAIVIALVLLVLLVVVAVGKGSKRQSVSRGGHPDKPERISSERTSRRKAVSSRQDAEAEPAEELSEEMEEEPYYPEEDEEPAASAEEYPEDAYEDAYGEDGYAAVYEEDAAEQDDGYEAAGEEPQVQAVYPEDEEEDSSVVYEEPAVPEESPAPGRNPKPETRRRAENASETAAASPRRDTKTPSSDDDFEIFDL